MMDSFTALKVALLAVIFVVLILAVIASHQ
jgi:hypothetical protein